MLLMEILLSIHCLLLISSWFIGSQKLTSQPSFKLKLARFLLVSCVVSPLIVHCVHFDLKPVKHKYISIDTLKAYVNLPIVRPNSSESISKPTPISAITNPTYYSLLYLVFFLLILFRTYRVLLDLIKLKTIVDKAVAYRTSGKLIVKISDRCHIPFSVYLFNKAYILLPVSLFSSSKNVKIAIAHEGQHHRNRDCLWAYFMEALRIVFWGNPGVNKWHNVLSELQELSCDEVLVGHQKISAYDYGRCLFQVVQAVSQCSLLSNREFACTVGMALNTENKESAFIIRRISMLSTYPLNVSRPLLLGAALAGLSMLAPICASYAALGSITTSQSKEIDVSHLDPKIQQVAAKEIAIAVHQYQAKSGVIAVVDPSSGNIIAFAEAGKNKEDSSWKSRVFSPGSTIKPFIAAAAIDVGISSESKLYDCPSPYYIEGKMFTNYNAEINSISLTDALSKSVNTCLIKVAQDAGPSVIRKKLEAFGFDMKSWWRTNQSDNLQLAKTSLGENIPVTVETLAKSFAILANKGYVHGQNASSVISATTAESVTRMLEKSVQNGTGIRAAIPGISVAGKTGTVAEDVNFAKAKHLSLFAGYVPANKPQYVMLVVIEDGYLNKNGETLASGGELAAPVFRNVAIKSLKFAKQ
ncbi:penicillin-binding transpeptidase domain-containing protein [Legionella sp. D16C41]|uniref:M56 family metallopeptidase n=1 Tax=Legionella sp. D16C41 TaxID=3402688 RepID=UPI003AF92311